MAETIGERYGAELGPLLNGVTSVEVQYAWMIGVDWISTYRATLMSLPLRGLTAIRWTKPDGTRGSFVVVDVYWPQPRLDLLRGV